jgi:queuine tRNA-ribosyltransferase
MSAIETSSAKAHSVTTSGGAFYITWYNIITMSRAAAQPSFSITKTSRVGRARLGLLKTSHGNVRTPAYVIVATHAAIRTLKPSDIKKTKTQMVISNTYHLWDRKNVHKKLGVRMPMMTDSGGFQVFSLGAAREQGVGKVLKRNEKSRVKSEKFYSGVRITEKGVHFKVDDKKRFISPETSIAAQERLGANLIFAFDECTSPLHPYTYNKAAMERTHRWAKRCLAARTRKDQMMLGIVQGGRFKSLRTKSAKVLAVMPFDGYGICGSFGKDEMRKTLEWVIPHLPGEKFRHLLGIGSVADIFTAVESGVDTFDCVIPTREARHGKIYTDYGPVDVRKKSAAKQFPAMHRLFRAHDLRAGRLATLHNVRWFNRLLENIRAALADGSYRRFKREFLTRFSSSRI